MKKSILAAAVLLALSIGVQGLAQTAHGKITKVTDYLYEITYTNYDYVVGDKGETGLGEFSNLVSVEGNNRKLIIDVGIAKTYYDTVPKEERIGKVQITISTSFFIPKPFTPFEWAPMYTPDTYLEKAHFLNDSIKEQLNKKSIRYNWHDAKTSVIEGLLARGDRKVSAIIKDAYMGGALFDSWTDFFNFDIWKNAIDKAEHGLDFYVYRNRELDEIFPWDFIDIGVTKDFLIREWNNALNERITPNCAKACSGCGANCFKGGICFEN